MSDVLAGSISRYASFEFQYLTIPLPTCLRLAAFMLSIDRVSFRLSRISPDTSVNLSGLDNLSSPALSVSESFATSCRRYYPRLSWLRKSSSVGTRYIVSLKFRYCANSASCNCFNRYGVDLCVYLKFINLEFIIMR